MIIGKRLSGRYEIIRLIGTGGMSNVYLARDIILDRNVAVKLMRMSMANEEQLVRRFRREALATTQLMHPHIVDIFDVDEDHDNHFIVMEYIDGMDLKAYINKKGRLPLPQVITIMHQILGAIAHAHHQQIIHRDIKPQNILIDQEGNAKITDFGIAMALFETSMTQTNTTLGSVHYLSPEQARGGIATTKSDVYSLGIMLYEMLTGKLPFDGESAVAIAIQQLQSAMPLLADELPSAPMSLQNIVMKATAKDAANRYLSVEEMQSDLATALQPSRINEAPYDIHKMDFDQTKTIPLPSGIIKEKIADIANLSAQKPLAKRKPSVVPKEKTIKKEKKSKRKKWVITILILALIALVVTYFYYDSQKTYAVADVADVSQQVAISRLQKDGFHIGKTIEKHSEKVKKGYIIKTNPPAGKRVKKGTKIDLYISIGKEEITVEDYRGENVNEMKKVLEKLGFKKVKTVAITNDTVNVDEVTGQSIQAGLKVIPSETTIEIEYSAGPEDIVLKDLTGYNTNSVKAYALENGFELTIKEVFSDDIEVDQVVSQEPAAGNSLKAGAPLKVTISKGVENPDKTVERKIKLVYTGEIIEASSDSESDSANDNDTEDETTEANSASPEPTRTPQTIKVYLKDKTHKLTDVYKTLTITEDTEITLLFDLAAGTEGAYKIERDDKNIEQETVGYK